MTRLRRTRWLGALLMVLLLGGCATVSPAPRISALHLPPQQTGRARHNLRVFDDVWTTVDSNYYDAKFHGVDWRAAALEYGPKAAVARDDDALYAELNRMLDKLEDGHTAALSPRDAHEFKVRERALTGMRSSNIAGRWVVVEVMSGGAAEAAGVKPGWVIVKRNGQPYDPGMPGSRPVEGEVVHWEFLDDHDQPVALDLVARPLSTKAERAVRVLAGGVVYLRFDEFDWTDEHWLSGELKRHRDAPGLIIDLRSNAGGNVFMLDLAVGEFFTYGFDHARIVSRGGSSSKLHTFQLGSAHYRGPVAVLVGAHTASAAEVFSAAMQEEGRAKIIGRKTSGNVLVSWFHHLPDDGLLQYSRYDLFTHGGRRLEGHGVEPDLIVPLPTLADIRAGRDPDVEAALDSLPK